MTGPRDLRARPKVTPGLRFDPDLYDRVRAAAEERGVSIVFLVDRLLREGLDRLIPADEFTLTRPSGDGT